MTGFLRDIALTYIRPAAVMRKKMAAGLREETLLAYLMFACLISFFVRLPGLVALHRAAQGGTPLETEIGGMFVATLFFAPLFLYALAAISRLGARLFGGGGDWRGARLALFWTILALQPVVIASVYLSARLPFGPARSILSIVFAGFFLLTWVRALIATESAPAPAHA